MKKSAAKIAAVCAALLGLLLVFKKNADQKA